MVIERDGGSRVDEAETLAGDGERGPRCWWLVMYGGVGCPEMYASSCGASVSLLVMRYRAVASWMVLGDRRWEKKWMA